MGENNGNCIGQADWICNSAAHAGFQFRLEIKVPTQALVSAQGHVQATKSICFCFLPTGGVHSPFPAPPHPPISMLIFFFPSSWGLRSPMQPPLQGWAEGSRWDPKHKTYRARCCPTLKWGVRGRRRDKRASPNFEMWGERAAAKTKSVFPLFSPIHGLPDFGQIHYLQAFCQRGCDKVSVGAE